MQSIILALAFALHFALMFLGVIISIYMETWLGLLLVAFILLDRRLTFINLQASHLVLSKLVTEL